MSTTAPAIVVLPNPVSPALDGKLTAAVNAIKAGKSLQVDVTATLKGAEASVGYRVRDRWTVGAWVAQEWRGGLDAGLRVGYSR